MSAALPRIASLTVLAVTFAVGLGLLAAGPQGWAGRGGVLLLAAALGLVSGGLPRAGLAAASAALEVLLRLGMTLLVLLPGALLAEWVLAPAIGMLARDEGIGPILLLAGVMLALVFLWWRWWPAPALLWHDALESEPGRWASLSLERRLLLRRADHFWHAGLWMALLLALPLAACGWLAANAQALTPVAVAGAAVLALLLALALRALLTWALRRDAGRPRHWSFLDDEEAGAGDQALPASDAEDAEDAAAPAEPAIDPEAAAVPAAGNAATPAQQLLQAAARGDQAAIAAALAAGADPEQRPDPADADQRRALCRAAASGQVGAVRALLAAGARVDAAEAGQSALLAATGNSFSGRIEVVNALLANGADPRVADAQGRTPLHHAALCRDAGVAAALLDAGADIDALDQRQYSALAVAVEQHNLALVEVLLKRGAQLCPADGVPVLLAMAQGNDDRHDPLPLLLQHKARLDVVDTEGRDALQLASLHGHAALVEALLEAGASVAHRCHRGRTALHWAAEAGQTRVLQRLTFWGPPPDLADQAGDTALHLAVRSDRPSAEVVRLLLAQGVPPERHNGSGKRAIDMALEMGRWQLVRAIDPAVPVPASFSAEAGDTPPNPVDPAAVLGEALRSGRPQLARELLRNCELPAPALAAALQALPDDADPALLSLLLDAGLDPGEGDPAALDHLLARRPCPQALFEVAFQRLLAQPRNRATLLLARAPVSVDADWLLQALRRALRAGALATARDGERRSALHWALRLRSDAFVEALLAAAPALNLRDGAGQSALHLLALRPAGDRLALARAMIRAGADPAVSAGDGSTPAGLALARGDQALADVLDWPTLAHPGRALKEADLARAARAGDRATVQRLLQLGLPLDGRDERGATALIHAAGAGQLDLVTDLIGLGADTDAATSSGATALSAACVSGHLPVIKLLLDAGVPVDQPMRQGLTPLMVAASVLRSDVVELLLKRGARISQLAGSGLSALEAAVLSALNQGANEAALACVRLLLERRAPVESAPAGQPGLLHRIVGAEQNRPPAPEPALAQLLSLLLARGANPDRQDERRRTPLHWACRHALTECIDLLLRAGANPRAEDSLRQLPHDLLPPRLRAQWAARLPPQGSLRR